MALIRLQFRGSIFSKMRLNANSTVSYWPYAVVASVSGWLFAWFQAVPELHDPDSFYHIRLTWLMLHHGLFDRFPWLQFTDLAQHFTDQHLMYHLLLLPLFLVLPPVVAAKVLQAVSVVGLMLLLFHQLQRWRLPYALPAMLALLSTSPFLIRLQLVKASVLAIILFLLILWSILERRYGWTAVLTVLYVWTHAGFILAAMIAVVVWFSQGFTEYFQHERWRWPSFRPILVVGSALVVSVVTNPYFPSNLQFLWEQLVQIGLVNYGDAITVGAEWYPFALPDFVAVLSIMGIALVSAVGLCIYYRQRYRRDLTAVTLGVLVVIFTVATLRSRRYIEYLTPLLWLWSCYIVLPYLVSPHWRKLRRSLQQQWGKFYRILLVYFAITIPMSIGLAVVRAYGVILDGIPLSTLQRASYFLRDHVPPGTIVFHGNWDEFPMLFFHNPSQYYIVGLDPTFMYLYDQPQYQRWQDIASGKSKQQSAHDIVQWFDTHYVILQRHKEHTKLLQAYLLRDQAVRVVYQDRTSIVFHIL